MAITKLSNSGIKTGQLKYDSLLAGNDAYYPADFFSIATTTVGSGGSSSVTFSSIPGTYSHLQIRAIARSTDTGQSAGSGNYMNITFNGSSFAYYHHLQGNGSSASTYSQASLGAVQRITNANDGANIFGAFITDILDYKDTNKYKTLRNLGGFDVNGNGRITLNSAYWASTSAVTSIVLSPEAGNFAQYSTFALYGIKGS